MLKYISSQQALRKDGAKLREQLMAAITRLESLPSGIAKTTPPS